ncbi:hypothetical protein ACFLZ5_09940 [Thermodesulfobacteriota bacterium]
MAEYVRKNDEQEAFTFGMFFMAFIMAFASLTGIWFLAVLIKMISKMIV